MAPRITLKEGAAFTVNGGLCVVMKARRGVTCLAIISERNSVHREGHLSPEQLAAVAPLKQQVADRRKPQGAAITGASERGDQDEN